MCCKKKGYKMRRSRFKRRGSAGRFRRAGAGFRRSFKRKFSRMRRRRSVRPRKIGYRM